MLIQRFLTVAVVVTVAACSSCDSAPTPVGSSSGQGGHGAAHASGGSPASGGHGGGDNATAGGGGGPNGAGGSAPQVNLDGTYLVTASINQAPKRPVLIRSVITSSNGGKTLLVDAVALSAADRKTEVGSHFAVGPFSLANDGTFNINIPALDLPGEANPVTGTQILGNVTMSGTADPDFSCGALTGNLTKPFEIDMTGSTFTMQRVTGTDYPEPPAINCAKDLADPLTARR